MGRRRKPSTGCVTELAELKKRKVEGGASTAGAEEG